MMGKLLQAGLVRLDHTCIIQQLAVQEPVSLAADHSFSLPGFGCLARWTDLWEDKVTRDVNSFDREFSFSDDCHGLAPCCSIC